jgi:uncharacterized protein YggT (Ycf19 family)
VALVKHSSFLNGLKVRSFSAANLTRHRYQLLEAAYSTTPMRKPFTSCPTVIWQIDFSPNVVSSLFVLSVIEEEKQVGDTWLLEKSTSRTLDKLAFNDESSSGLKSETPGRKN